MKNSAKRRRTKAEIEEKCKEDEKERQEIEELKYFKETMEHKRYKLEVIPQVLEKNEELIAYLRANGLIDENGKMLTQSQQQTFHKIAQNALYLLKKIFRFQ
eukprot:TRINITY_DN54851_c0_g1_i1.p3 TRINITY_DN54851_c0_g1~~TRINITY_DN54851_c0_g1_i1.p3  ORF type:complete len:102 (-),score=18.49 TRINITY_DN54851_c0_g1_i1:23-328(-)